MLPPFVQNSVLRGLELRCSDLADNSFFALACLAHPCTLVPHKSCKSMVRFGSGMVIAHFISGFKSSFDLHFLSCLCPTIQQSSQKKNPGHDFEPVPKDFRQSTSIIVGLCGFIVKDMPFRLPQPIVKRQLWWIYQLHPATDWNHAKEKEICTVRASTLSRSGQQVYLRQKQMQSPVHDFKGGSSSLSMPFPMSRGYFQSPSQWTDPCDILRSHHFDLWPRSAQMFFFPPKKLRKTKTKHKGIGPSLGESQRKQGVLSMFCTCKGVWPAFRTRNTKSNICNILLNKVE